MKRRQVLAAFGSATVALPFASARAAGFPEKPVRIVVPFSAGNTLDTALRVAADAFYKSTGQLLIVDSKPGGGGVIAAQNVTGSAPDGYTMLLASSSMMTINPHTFSKLPYDPEKSFKPITNMIGSALVFAVNSGVPAYTLAEFIAWAKANRGKVSFASFTAGSASHFAGILLNQRAGLDMVHVPFNGTPPATQALMAGQVQAAFVTPQAVKPHIDSGRLRVLAISSPERAQTTPTWPTFHEQGFPELDIWVWSAAMAPAGTPDAIVAKLNSELVKAMAVPEVIEKWRTMDLAPLPTTPQELAGYMKSESSRWGEVIKASGFKIEE